jgi:hypothetical protein
MNDWSIGFQGYISIWSGGIQFTMFLVSLMDRKLVYDDMARIIA